VTASRAALLGVLLCAPATAFCPGLARAQGGGPAKTLTVQTVPVLEDVPFTVGRRTFRTDALGRALVVGSAPRLVDRIRIPDTEIAPGVRARFSRRKGGKYLFDLLYRVQMSFRDVAGRRVDSSRVTSVTFKGSHGVRRAMKRGGSQWLQGARVVATREGHKNKKLTWVVEKAIVDGSNVVNRNQQSFVPARTQRMRVELLLYPAHFSARDALLKFPLGSRLRLEYPNGRVERHAFGDNAELTLHSLPRGEYVVSVEGPGIAFERPLALSREQTVELELLSYLDLGLGLGVLAAIALGLILVGRPHLARVPRRLSTGLPRALEDSLPIARRRRTSRSRRVEEPRQTTRRRRQEWLNKPPNWRDSIPRAAIAGVAFGVLVVLLFGRDPSVGAMLAVFMFLLYLPLSYGTDRAVYKTRSHARSEAIHLTRRRRRRNPPSKPRAGRRR
jgi:hypothetical protein